MKTTDFLKNLIAFPSVSSETNLNCIDYIQDLLTSQGFECLRTYNKEKTKANLVAHIGPAERKGLFLSGHTDVVPVDGQQWTTDPFTLSLRDGKLYGRGTCDMKGFLAAVLYCIHQVPLATLQAPLILAFTYDEEVGCVGAKQLPSLLRQLPVEAQLGVVGEPTSLKPVVAHKGIQCSCTHFRGRPAHSSSPHLGKSAIAAASQFIQQLPSLIPDSQDERFTPPTATWNVGQIEGGSGVNIIPEHCKLTWEMRLLPGQSPELINQKMDKMLSQQRDKKIGVEQNVLSWVPAFEAKQVDRTLTVLSTILGQQEALAVPFATEAGILQEGGFPTVVCGPGDIAQAHTADEWIDPLQLALCEQFLTQLIKQICL